MIIEREVSTDIMLILIVIFDQGNQYRMRKKLSETLQKHSVLRIGNGPV